MIRNALVGAILATLLLGGVVVAQQVGSIRGAVFDQDFDAPLPEANVEVLELGQKSKTSLQGNFSLTEVKPGQYTLVFSKEGYVRQIKANVVVTAGQLTDVDVRLAGEFTDMEEFVVADALQLGGGSEAALLNLRFESPSLIDAISSDLLSRAGASDAAGALRLVAGASTRGDSQAVIRGLPDRYVSSQINGVRLPSADDDTRAVELDQFPSAIIESIQVSKTFTPDQQGDASGGAVNVKLKGIPDQPLFFQVKTQTGFNTQAAGRRNSFLTYDGGGVSFLGFDDGGRDVQFDNLGGNWDGAVGVSGGEAPIDYKWSMAGGGSHDFGDDVKVGGFASLFYERDSSFFDNGRDDSYWVENPGDPLTPRGVQGQAGPNQDDFKTALFDVTEATKSVQWGGLGAVGLETEHNKLTFTYLYTRTVEDTATLAEDTRGKQYFFPGFDPNDPTTPGHGDQLAAPYIRLETLEYTERETQTLQLHGTHTLPVKDIFGRDDLFHVDDLVSFKAPELDWTLAFSEATSNQPDKRQFGAQWFPDRQVGSTVIPANYRVFLPAATINLGNLQRIYQEIEESSDQYQVNLKFPFEQWDGEDGFFKFGIFRDDVTRKFDQDTFSNFGDASASFVGDFNDSWSAAFRFEDHAITESTRDVDYEGEQNIAAWYAMLQLPVTPELKLTGGVRFESTKLSIVNEAEELATFFPPGQIQQASLTPGAADVDFEQTDVLPSIGLEYTPLENLTFRAAYNETIARQTFRELTPILQQEFLGGSIFIGNPELEIANVKNYDLRVDWTPYAGGLVSVSWFKKDIENAIEFVQRVRAFDFTTAVNYPEGTLSGFEFDVRQDLGFLFDDLEGLSLGANATLIHSEVTLPDDERLAFEAPNIAAPMKTRDATGAPDYLYNIYLTYDRPDWGTQATLFYSVQGDTLVSGAAESNGNFVPSIYALAYGTLNFSISQRLGDHLKLQFQAKNLTNPDIEEVYRSEYVGDDLTKTSFSRGIEFSISLSAEFRF